MSDTSNPAHIERDLDETRSRLGNHLNELQDRLSPGQVLDDLMGYFRGSEGAAFGQNLVANIRANPMPAAITGIGLAWLMASNPRGTHSRPPSSRSVTPRTTCVIRSAVPLVPLRAQSDRLEAQHRVLPGIYRRCALAWRPSRRANGW